MVIMGYPCYRIVLFSSTCRELLERGSSHTTKRAFSQTVKTYFYMCGWVTCLPESVSENHYFSMRVLISSARKNNNPKNFFPQNQKPRCSPPPGPGETVWLEVPRTRNIQPALSVQLRELVEKFQSGLPGSFDLYLTVSIGEILRNACYGTVGFHSPPYIFRRFSPVEQAYSNSQKVKSKFKNQKREKKIIWL